MAIIGIGPDPRTPRAKAEPRRASVIVGSDQYIEQLQQLLRSGTDVRATELGAEEARAAEAVELAACGQALKR